MSSAIEVSQNKGGIITNIFFNLEFLNNFEEFGDFLEKVRIWKKSVFVRLKPFVHFMHT